MVNRFSINARSVQRALAASEPLLFKWVQKAFKQHGVVYKRAMGDRFGVTLDQGRNPGTDRLASRTGALEGSIGSTLSGSTLQTLKLTFHIGNTKTSKYAAIQEEGGTIRGRPWLAVPLPAALTGTGRSRIERPGLVKGKPGWFLTKTKAGNLLIGKKVGEGVEFWWILKRSVKIPARLGFDKTVKGIKLKADRILRVNGAIKRALKEATKTSG